MLIELDFGFFYCKKHKNGKPAQGWENRLIAKLGFRKIFKLAKKSTLRHFPKAFNIGVNMQEKIIHFSIEGKLFKEYVRIKKRIIDDIKNYGRIAEYDIYRGVIYRISMDP